MMFQTLLEIGKRMLYYSKSLKPINSVRIPELIVLSEQIRPKILNLTLV